MKTVTALFTTLFLIITVVQAENFKFIKSEKGIALYERWVSYHGYTVRELKVNFEVMNTGIEDMIALLKNNSKGNQWNTKCSQYKIAKTPDEHVWLNYIRYKLPWPMEDQDCSLKYQAMPATGLIAFESIEHAVYPRVKNVSRLEGTKGKWLIEKLPANKSKITYQILTNKSANVPRWVSDPIIYDNIINTMSRFKLLLQAR